MKREEEGNQPIIVTVTCPINFDHPASGRRRNGCGRACQGTFHVDMANIPISNSDDNMVIDLCDDKGEEVVSITATGIVKVKKEECADEYQIHHHHHQQQQQQQPSGQSQSIVAVKIEDIHPTSVLSSLNATIPCSLPSSTSAIAQVVSSTNSPNLGETVCDLKPLFEKGDNVYAAWWDPDTDTKRRNKAEWFPGVVLSYEEASIGASSKYGPTRLYHIMFDDGDELDNIEDYFVCSKTDYELTVKYKKPIGVRNRRDAKSTDEWAKIVGWYEITGEDGKVQSFSLLTDAMRAHDAIVVRKHHGSHVKRSFLNIPEDYPELFAPTHIEAPEERMEEDESVDARNATTRQIRTNMVSPESLSMVGIKRDHNGYSDENVVPEDRIANSKRLRQELESRRLDPCLEAKLLRTDFWSVREDDIQFTEQAFVNKALFHINFFLDSSKKVNEGFSLFVGSGVVTPGFDPLPTTLDIEKIAGWTERELQCAIASENNDDWGASTTAQWLKNADVGSFVILRHEYRQCPFCPKRLMKDGKYIGPVYVIGVITKKVLPWSKEERDIADNKLGKFSRSRWPIHTVCRVRWKKMGYKKSLKKSTWKYINSICQPTFVQISNKPEKEFSCGATSESIRCDLWNNANIRISSDDFQDEFDYSTSRGRAWVSKFCQVGKN